MSSQRERYPEYAAYSDVLESLSFDPFDAEVAVGTFIRPPSQGEVSDLLWEHNNLTRALRTVRPQERVPTQPPLSQKVLESFHPEEIRGDMIDAEGSERGHHFNKGKLAVLDPFLRRLGQHDVIDEMKQGRIKPTTEMSHGGIGLVGENIAKPVDMTYITDEYVVRLLRAYGYERRFYGRYGNSQLASAEIDPYESKNPLGRILFVGGLHRARKGNLQDERVTGEALGKIIMLRQILDLLGHTAQAETIEENADLDIDIKESEQLALALEVNEHLKFADELEDMR